MPQILALFDSISSGGGIKRQLLQVHKDLIKILGSIIEKNGGKRR
jgi:hypothetical protein